MLIRVIAGIIAAATALVSWQSAAFAAEDVKIAIVSRTVFYVPAWIAERKGFFKDENLNVEIKVYNNAEQIDSDLRAGKVQISISTPESVVGDVYRGGSLRIIAGNAEKLPHFIIAKPSIKSLADLKGAKFGVLSLKEGTTYLVQHLAGEAKLKSNEYQIEAVGGAPTRWRLLKDGKIDVGLQPFPLSYEADAAGFSNLGPISKYIPNYQFTSINVDSKWAESNVKTVAGVLRALKRGQDYMAAHQAEAAEIAAQELKTKPELALRALQDTAKLQILSKDMSASKAGLAYVFEILQKADLVPQNAKFDFDKVVDGRYLKAAR
ncbi:MAG: ABC transporter substrate-binding protein [Xanthobacteraceae bacterium]